MHLRTSFFLIVLFSVSSLFAQPQMPDVVTPMRALDFMVGEWEGDGWMMTPTGSRETFAQKEWVSSEIGGAALLIKGQGVAGDSMIHDALAVVNFDAQKQQYRMQSYLATGRNGNFEGEVPEAGTFVWKMEFPGRIIRYTLKIADGKWKEVGEMKRGDNWFPFFEMNLTRIE